MVSFILVENIDFWYFGYQYYVLDCFSFDMYQFKFYCNNIVGVFNEQCSLIDYSWGNIVWFDFGSVDLLFDFGLGFCLMWDYFVYFLLLVSSIVIDNGVLVMVSFYFCEDYDMRGCLRLVGVGCDIGVMEW